ncbi:GTPase domain-containing protein [Streptomyces sp. NPDC048606]|uniref:GTPase domain-containing protein n=1 Tax=Streptomyces sp. NPDC048606 TaxID=3154726 RepID=UPI003440775E
MTSDFDPAAAVTVLNRVHALLPLPDKDVTSALATLQLCLDRSHLAVVGPEGVGKSTLVNVLLDADVAPRERVVPGTVAPLYVLHHDRAEPRFRVLRAEAGTGNGEVWEETSGRPGLDRWMLQRHNADNAKRVVRGEVAIRSDVLRDGLRIVDLPGLAGLSAGIAERTARDLAEGAFTVVLVCQGRSSLAQLADIVGELAAQARPARIAAIVFNEADLESLSAQERTESLAMRRRSVDTYLLPRDTGGRLGLAEATLHEIDLKHPEPDAVDELRARLVAEAGRARRAEASRAAAEATVALEGALHRRVERVALVLAGRVGPEEIRRHAAAAAAWPEEPGSGAARPDPYQADTARHAGADWEPYRWRVEEEYRRWDATYAWAESHDGFLSRANGDMAEYERRIMEGVDRMTALHQEYLGLLEERLQVIGREQEARLEARVPSGLTPAEFAPLPYERPQASEVKLELSQKAREIDRRLARKISLAGMAFAQRTENRIAMRRLRHHIADIFDASDGPPHFFLRIREESARRFARAAHDRLDQRARTAQNPTEASRAVLRRDHERLDEARAELAALIHALGGEG